MWHIKIDDRMEGPFNREELEERIQLLLLFSSAEFTILKNWVPQEVSSGTVET